MSIKCLFGHKWAGCVCTRCGKTRFFLPNGREAHTWDGCKCSVCQKRNTFAKKDDHIWDGCYCVACGLQAPVDALGRDVFDMHDWEAVSSSSEEITDGQVWLGGHFSTMTETITTNKYRCRRCGMERETKN